MLTRYVLPETQKMPSAGKLNCELAGTCLSALASQALNLAFDYHLIDGRMRLVLSVLQKLQDNSVTGVDMHGVEIAFDKDILSGKFAIANGQVHATYWQLAVEENQRIFRAFRADSGIFVLDFDEQQERYKGSFSFECFGSVESNSQQVNVTQGTFEISGRDEFTL